MFTKQYQNLGLRTISKNENLSQATQLAWMLLTDFRSGTRTSLGSMQVNGDFEAPISGGTTPLYWPTAATNGTAVLESTLSTYIHSGTRSVRLTRTGAEAIYTSTVAIKLQAGAAYMVTGWCKSDAAGTTYKLSLKSTGGGTEVAFITGSSITWSRHIFRYPSTGTYVAGTVIGDRVNLNIGITGGTGNVYFDDVAVTPLRCVLLDKSQPSTVNVSTAVANISDPADAAGFHFARWEDGTLFLYRYRLSDFKTPYLIREKFDPVTQEWTKAWGEKLGANINSLIFSFNPNDSYPAKGKESVLTVDFVLKDNFAKNANANGVVISFKVAPASS